MREPPEWIHEGLPFWGATADVWLTNGQVRRVVRDPINCGMRFVDGGHPLSNAYCHDGLVLAWRPAAIRQSSS